MGFVRTTSGSSVEDDFLGAYIDVLDRDRDGAPTWLLQNRRFMKQEMFDGLGMSRITDLTPVQVMAIRACAPAGVFTPEAKLGYMQQVAGNTVLEGIATMLFGSDRIFEAGMPEDCAAQLRTLMQMAKLAPKS